MTVVVKVGGALIESDFARISLMQRLKPLMAARGVVLIHGGGAQASALAKRMGHTPRMVNGRRVTTDLDLDIHLWIAVGELNARLAAAAFASGLSASGISGASGGMLEVVRRAPRLINGETIDFGWVGDIMRVEPTLLTTLLERSTMPIVAPLGVDRAGLLYNVNADSVAAHLSLALNAQSLIFLAESGGLRQSADPTSARIAEVDRLSFAQGQREGWIRDGMIAKLENAFAARSDGVANVYICAPEDLEAPERGTRIL